MGKPGDTLFEEDRTQKGHSRYSFPDQLSFNKEPFATVIPTRAAGTFKVHKTEGLANSALSHHHEGAKYKQMHGVWVKVWEFYDPTNCESCGNFLDEERDGYKDYWGRKTEWLQSPLHKGSLIFAPFLCRICYDAEEEIVMDRQKAKAWRVEQKRRAEFDAANKN